MMCKTARVVAIKFLQKKLNIKGLGLGRKY